MRPKVPAMFHLCSGHRNRWWAMTCVHIILFKYIPVSFPRLVSFAAHTTNIRKRMKEDGNDLCSREFDSTSTIALLSLPSLLLIQATLHGDFHDMAYLTPMHRSFANPMRFSHNEYIILQTPHMKKTLHPAQRRNIHSQSCS